MPILSLVLYLIGLIALYFVKIPAYVLIILAIAVFGLTLVKPERKAKAKALDLKLTLIGAAIYGVTILILYFIRTKLNIVDPNADISSLIKIIYNGIGIYSIVNFLEARKLTDKYLK